MMFSRWRTQRSAVAHLMRYWDEVVTGTGAHESERALEASLSDTVLAMHRSYDAQPADPAFSSKLLRELTDSYQDALTRRLEPINPAMREFSANGRAMVARPAPQVEPRPLSRRRLALAAVCLLLVLAGSVAGYVVLSSGDNGEIPSIPAVIESTPAATPVPDLTSQTLLEQHFAAGELVASDEDVFIWNRYSLAPGTTLHYSNECGAPKITVAYVESGRFAIRAEGPLQVTRAGVTETVPARAEVSLLAGDGFLYINTTGDQLLGFRNPGPESLVVTEAIWRLEECVDGPPSTSTIIWDAYDYEPAIDPSRPVVITLRRITALSGVDFSSYGPAGAGWLSSEARILERIYVEAGNLEVIKYVPDASGTPSALRVYQYPEGRTGVGGTFTLDLDMDPPGTTFLISNSGSDPLIISLFTVAYEDVEATSAAPSPADP